jgi:hypothetical protein
VARQVVEEALVERREAEGEGHLESIL